MWLKQKEKVIQMDLRKLDIQKDYKMEFMMLQLMKSWKYVSPYENSYWESKISKGWVFSGLHYEYGNQFAEVDYAVRALCIKLLSWNEKKKAVTNLKNDEE